MVDPLDPVRVPVALRRELLAQGYSDKGLRAAVRRGELARVRQGAYVDGGAWAGLDDVGRHAVRGRAAVRQAKTGVFLSHSSALPFLGTPLWRVDLAEVHLSRRDGRLGRNAVGVRQHCGHSGPGDVWVTEGVPHSSPARAALEVTTVASTEPALVVIGDLLSRELCTLAEVRAQYEERMVHWPRSLRTDLVLRLAHPALESVGEVRSWYLFWRQSLPRPIPQYEIRDGARLVARVDFALPEHGIWIEFDGRAKYTEFLRAGESVADAVLREKQREDLIRELTG